MSQPALQDIEKLEDSLFGRIFEYFLIKFAMHWAQG